MDLIEPGSALLEMIDFVSGSASKIPSSFIISVIDKTALRIGFFNFVGQVVHHLFALVVFDDL